ncbi:hypothetical protein ILYODFUR_030677 [Ilyodon furcidens]|uniref:Uncharacterized protein n=1 Tax=Ilyodon furcidens TaxID=33524 RepID=A0ABV0UZP0_9TELE
MHVATVERKNSLLTGRNLQQNQNQAQCERTEHACSDSGEDYPGTGREASAPYAVPETLQQNTLIKKEHMVTGSGFNKELYFLLLDQLYTFALSQVDLNWTSERRQRTAWSAGVSDPLEQD